MPFKAIYPPSELAGDVAAYIESMTIREAKEERDRNPLSYIHILMPNISESTIPQIERKDVAFSKIAENFDNFLSNNTLIEDYQPQVYLVEIRCGNQVQKGIWTLTSIDDYLEGRIKKHELIRPERKQLILSYLENVHLDSNPALITYKDNAAINTIISRCQGDLPFLQFQSGNCEHRLWKIGSLADIGNLQNEFNAITAYIADGHHRAAAFATYGLKRRIENSQHTGKEAYNFFSTVYMAAGQLRISAYHRLVKDLNGLASVEFLQAVRRNFHIHQIASSQAFSLPGSFRMYLDGMIFLLMPKDHVLNRKGIVANLEVSLLQDYILAPILNVSPSKTDSRVMFKGGDIDESQLFEEVERGEFRILFLLNPLPVETILRVADAGEIMPPKTTFVHPKFPAGLLIHKTEEP